jgi:hypothetical protein
LRAAALCRVQPGVGFFIGGNMKNRTHSKDDLLQGQWAAKLVSRCPNKSNLTAKLLHYRTLSNPQHAKPDSSEYTNTIEDYKYLVDACDKARCMGLIPFHLFNDYESPSISQNIFAPAYCPNLCHWHVIFKHMFDRLCISYTRCMADKLNPVHIEIWVDNSSSAPLIQPISDRYNINLIASHQPISTSAIFQFVRRISHIRKPIRVLHLSDFDPVDVTCHIKTKTKLEILLEHFRMTNKLNLKVRHLMLSPDQCINFGLPTEPDSRNLANPKTELLALEAAKPGYIGRTLEQNLNRYIDLSPVKKTSAVTQKALHNLLPQFSRIIDNSTSLERAMRYAEKQLFHL